MYDNLYCKVFIDSNVEYEELLLMIMKYIGVEKKSFGYVAAEWCDIFINKNKEYSEEQYLQDSDNFLYWKYYLDIEPIDIKEEAYIEKISDLLAYLKQYYKGVKPACDFEDEFTKL